MVIVPIMCIWVIIVLSKMRFIVVSKLHVNLFSVNKLVINALNAQFTLNKCIVKSCNDEAIAIAPPEKTSTK